MSERELKTCPFCGCDAMFVERWFCVVAKCANDLCGIETPKFSSEHGTITAEANAQYVWNRRVGIKKQEESKT